MSKIILTSKDYWNEIEGDLSLGVFIKDLLKELVCSYLHNTVPPSISNNRLEFLKNSNISEIELDGKELTVFVFEPFNTETHRRFVFLDRFFKDGITTRVNS